MKARNIIHSVVLGVASILIYTVIATQLSNQYPWLLALAFVLIFISNLIDNPDLGNEPLIITKKGIIYLSFIILVAFIVIKFRDQYDEIKETMIFRLAVAVLLFTAWIYDVRKRHKRNKNA